MARSVPALAGALLVVRVASSGSTSRWTRRA
jgi:hypothetical protein